MGQIRGKDGFVVGSLTLNSWYAAQNLCTAQGGQLASFTDGDHQLRSLLNSRDLQRLTRENPFARIWLGAIREQYITKSMLRNITTYYIDIVV